MQTTCPECRTTFRVSQDHLGARRGLVRCGHCNAVFNAYDTLLPELEAPPEEGKPDAGHAFAEPGLTQAVNLVGASPALAEAYSEETRTVDDVVLLTDVDAARAKQFDSLPSRAADGALGNAVSNDLSAAAQEGLALAEEKTQPNILFEPMWPKSTQPERTWKFWLQIVLVLLLAGLLVLQVAYFLRAELVTFAPGTRPMLERLCQPLGCSVPLPRQLTQDAIAASALEHDPEQKSRVRLTFLLANRTGQTQTWPHIMLTLSDMREALVAQKVFPPQAYLPKDVKINKGMAPGVEREFRLDLDIGNLVASGYTLSLTYR